MTEAEIRDRILEIIGRHPGGINRTALGGYLRGKGSRIPAQEYSPILDALCDEGMILCETREWCQQEYKFYTILVVWEPCDLCGSRQNGPMRPAATYHQIEGLICSQCLSELREEARIKQAAYRAKRTLDRVNAEEESAAEVEEEVEAEPDPVTDHGKEDTLLLSSEHRELYEVERKRKRKSNPTIGRVEYEIPHGKDYRAVLQRSGKL
jgi:hypothetical protein